MIQLIYTSAATVPFSGPELVRLLRKSRENNEQRDLSGILLFHSDCFMQVLEGPEDSVDETYDRIMEDPRHRSVQMLARMHVAERSFGDWSMGFVHAESDWLKALPGFSDFFRTKGRPAKNAGPLAMQVLHQFKYGKLLRQVDQGRTALLAR